MDIDLPLKFDFNGWTIRYNILKSNPATSNGQQAKSAVFVHGTPWWSAVFKPTIDILLAKGAYNILVYDLPGYGQSQAYTQNNATTSSTQTPQFLGDTSITFQALALRVLLQHTNLDGKSTNPAPAIVAHDIAGTIALRAHLLLGCDFDSMLLIDTNCVLPWGDGFYTQARSSPQLYLDMPLNIFEAVVRAVIRSAVHDVNVLKTGWEDILASPWIAKDAERQRQMSFVRQIAQANDGDVREMLEGEMYGSVRCDVKILWGQRDQWIPREKIEDLKTQLGDRCKEVVHVPDAGHLVMLDHPGRFAVEVWDWLGRFRASKSLSSGET